MDELNLNELPDAPSAVLDEINSHVRKRRIQGVSFFAAFALYIPLLLLLPPGLAESIFLPGLIIVMSLTFMGIVTLATSGSVHAYVRAIHILQRLSPPEPVITASYAVLKIEKTFAFVLRKAPYALYFVSFSESPRSPVSRIEVPVTFWKWDSAVHIEGLRAHDRHGFFSIPTPSQELVSGEGNLLAIPLRGGSYVLRVPNFSKERLLAVADYVGQVSPV